jgi:hypothetical protein
MKEFSQSKKAFAKWKGQKAIREKFMQDATEIIRKTVMHSVLCYVDRAGFNTLNQQFQLSEVIPSPYALAGRACVSMADQWLRAKRNETAAANAEFIFEDGGPDVQGLLRAMLHEPGFPTPIHRPGRDIPDRRGGTRTGLVQLQAADFLAYECRKAKSDFTAKSGRDIRKSFRSLLGVEDVSMATCHAGNVVDILNICQIPQLKAR